MIAERLQKRTGCRTVHLPWLRLDRSEKKAEQLGLALDTPQGSTSGHIPASRHANKSKRSQKSKPK